MNKYQSQQLNYSIACLILIFQLAGTELGHCGHLTISSIKTQCTWVGNSLLPDEKERTGLGISKAHSLNWLFVQQPTELGWRLYFFRLGFF